MAWDSIGEPVLREETFRATLCCGFCFVVLPPSFDSTITDTYKRLIRSIIDG